MEMEKLNKILDFSIEESYVSDLKIPLWIWGLHGVGKTTAIKDWCKTRDIKCICLHTSTQDPGDLIGVPVVEDGQTIWGRPEWFPTEDDGKTLIFLDELNRANQDVLQCMLPFALEGKLHTHTLPKQCVVIAAGNPDVDGYTVSSVEDKALLSRFGHICLNADTKSWIKYVGQEDFDDSLMEAIQTGYSGFGSIQLSDWMTVDADPRSLDLVGKKLIVMGEELQEDIGQEFVSMFLGSAYGVLWRKEKQNNLNVFDGKQILLDYEKVRSQIRKQLNGIERRNDLLTVAIEVIVNEIKSTGDKFKFKTLDNITQFILDTGASGLQFFMQVCKDDKKCDNVIKHMSKSPKTSSDGLTTVDLLTKAMKEK